MRELFPGHYPLTEKEHEKLWGSGTIVLDTNVLLNPYRYSSELRDRFTRILSSVSSRLWIPHQVAKEFHDRRVSIIQEQHNLASELDAGFEKAFKQAKARLNDFKKNALIDVEALEAKLDTFYSDLKDEVKRNHSEALNNYGLTPQFDPMLERLADILQGHVGEPFSQEELDSIKPEAEKRYELEIPPGYKDIKKSGERSYGDYYLWRQVLEYAKQKGTDILLVTDDAKEDWWWRVDGLTLGPRPELRQEFMDFTGGHILYTYRSDYFISEMSKISREPLADGLLEEVKSASARAANRTTVAENDVYRTTLAQAIRNSDEWQRISEVLAELKATKEQASHAYEELVTEEQGALATLADIERRLGDARHLLSDEHAQDLRHYRDKILLSLGKVRDRRRHAAERIAELEGRYTSILHQRQTLKERAITIDLPESDVEELLSHLNRVVHQDRRPGRGDNDNAS